MRRKILKIVAGFIGIIALLLVIVFVISWKSPPYYAVTTGYNTLDSIVPFAQYNGEHPRPYIISRPQFVIFGASHTRDPKQAEIKGIEAEWNKLKPTIVLVEGRLGFLFPGLMDPVKTLGEGGKLMQLSKDAGVKIYNWDLSKEELAAKLKDKFTSEQIALAQILNPYFGQLRFGKPASPEQFVKEYLKRAAYVNEQQNFKTVNDVDSVWKKYFPTGNDWRDTSDETELPGYLSAMMIYNNDVRNQQLVAVVKELVAKGERPFLLCGSSHAACVAPAFK